MELTNEEFKLTYKALGAYKYLTKEEIKRTKFLINALGKGLFQLKKEDIESFIQNANINIINKNEIISNIGELQKKIRGAK